MSTLNEESRVKIPALVTVVRPLYRALLFLALSASCLTTMAATSAEDQAVTEAEMLQHAGKWAEAIQVLAPHADPENPTTERGRVHLSGFLIGAEPQLEKFVA